MLQVMDVTRFIEEKKINGPILSPDIWLGNSKSNFHPQGVMSEEIFGLAGSNERGTTYSWIDLNCKIINPAIYKILTDGIEKQVRKIVFGDKAYNISPEDGTLVEAENDYDAEITGLESFYQNIERFRFRDYVGKRATIIDMLYESIKKGTFFNNRLIVIPPKARDVSKTMMGGREEWITDELTTLYQQVVRLSYQAKSLQGTLANHIAAQIQQKVSNIYEHVKNKLGKKQGLVRRQMLGTRVDFSGRSVITPNKNLKIGEVGLPLKICLSVFEPFILCGIFNSSYSNQIPQEFHDAVKEFLGKEKTFE